MAWTPSARHARITRRAISPRLAIRTRLSTAVRRAEAGRGRPRRQPRRASRPPSAPSASRRVTAPLTPAARTPSSRILTTRLSPILANATTRWVSGPRPARRAAASPRRGARARASAPVAPASRATSAAPKPARAPSSASGIGQWVSDCSRRMNWRGSSLSADAGRRSVEMGGRGQAGTGDAAGRAEEILELRPPCLAALREPRRRREVAQDRRSRRDVAALVLDQPDQDPLGGRLVHAVDPAEMILVGGDQVGLEHAVDAHQSLDALIGALRLFDGVHERDEGRIRGLGHLGLRAQLGQPLAEDIGVLGIVPDVPAEQELRRQLGRERDPAAEDARHPLDGVAIVANEPRGFVGGRKALERVQAAGIAVGPGGRAGGHGHQ